MEKNHKARILEEFSDSKIPCIACLDIPDEYQYMDEKLIECIKIGTEYNIKNSFNIE